MLYNYSRFSQTPMILLREDLKGDFAMKVPHLFLCLRRLNHALVPSTHTRTHAYIGFLRCRNRFLSCNGASGGRSSSSSYSGGGNVSYFRTHVVGRTKQMTRPFHNRHLPTNEGKQTASRRRRTKPRGEETCAMRWTRERGACRRTMRVHLPLEGGGGDSESSVEWC